MMPVIPIADILDEGCDDLVIAAATGSGFMTISGVDRRLGLAEVRSTLLSFFGQDEDVRRATLRHKYDASRKNVYRGLYLAEPDKDTHVEGFDMGPDVADPARCGDGADPLTEPSPLPAVAGFAEAAGIYYRAMERLGGIVTRTLLRGLGAGSRTAPTQSSPARSRRCACCTTRPARPPAWERRAGSKRRSANAG